jgi:hypothetical protein
VSTEDVVDVLRNMVEAVEPGGLVLDLQVIRPNPVVEACDRVLCEIDGEWLFVIADAATAAVEAAIAAGRLVEEAIDDHDVRKHYADGADVVDDFAGKKRKLPPNAVPRLRTVSQPCVVRERCRLRRLRLTDPGCRDPRRRSSLRLWSANIRTVRPNVTHLQAGGEFWQAPHTSVSAT